MVGALEIQPVRRRALHEQVAEALRGLIAEGKLGPGDALPPERDLARQFGVSRVTVREALRTLQLVGLVETRQGGGNFVCEPSLDHVVAPLSTVLQHSRRRRAELLDARAVFEPAVARLAAERRSEADLAELEAILARQSERVARGELAVEEDSAFHLALARATGNGVVVHVIETINRLLLESRERSLKTPDRPRRSLEGHRRIAAAIRVRDAEAARRAMLDHIDAIGQSLRAAEAPS
ncbi:MAG TPA: FadR/GntR family transcriptional regulator [Chloroflexota bacterium]|jgi:GntR family transcriptional repressor for pyruvate dehydrogenase complex|nr:FadR/GntR family transcriptional regulator [Chloroflexota bacterium]